MGRPRKYDEKYGAQKNYQKEHSFPIMFRVFDSSNADMIAWLKIRAEESGTPDYIRRLIREDMERSGFVYTPAPEDSTEE